MTVKRIGPMSCGKVLGGLYGLLGLIIGTIFSLISLVGATVAGSNEGMLAAIFGVGAIIIFPLFYGVLGFIGGVISAALYNLMAGMFGGIEIEVQ
jgi:hypothetical protein